MADYWCIDGPLAGNSIVLDGPSPTVAIEVVDIDQDPESIPQHHYLIAEPAGPDGPGTLRFLATVVGSLDDGPALSALGATV